MQLEPTISPSSFEETYHALREQERRIYTNEELANLPEIKKDHPFYSEWKIRKRSAERLKGYLEKKQTFLRVLEVGCGNGWLSHYLASSRQCRVTGIDVHQAELEQGRQVFYRQKNLEFMFGNFLYANLTPEFDEVIFAASIQYFPSIPQVLDRALSLLSAEGEIHIMDSPFYFLKERSFAVVRSMDHFKKKRLPAMIRYYHHHCREDLEAYEHEILYSPNRILARLGFPQNPFPWIRIIK